MYSYNVKLDDLAVITPVFSVMWSFRNVQKSSKEQHLKMATTVFTVTFDQFKDHSLILDLLLLNKSFKHLLDDKLLNS